MPYYVYNLMITIIAVLSFQLNKIRFFYSSPPLLCCPIAADSPNYLWC